MAGEVKQWDLEEAMAVGFITEDALIAHTDKVLAAVDERAISLVITRQGRVAAYLTPMALETIAEVVHPMTQSTSETVSS